MHSGKIAKIAAFSLIGVGAADLLLGTTDHPLPVLGNYLSQQMDVLMIGVGAVILIFF